MVTKKWEVELWEWQNYLKQEADIHRRTFDKKIDAELWVKDRQMQGLVVIVKVILVTYDRRVTVGAHSHYMPTRKIIVDIEYS